MCFSDNKQNFLYISFIIISIKSRNYAKKRAQCNCNHVAAAKCIHVVGGSCADIWRLMTPNKRSFDSFTNICISIFRGPIRIKNFFANE